MSEVRATCTEGTVLLLPVSRRDFRGVGTHTFISLPFQAGSPSHMAPRLHRTHCPNDLYETVPHPHGLFIVICKIKKIIVLTS